MAIAKHPQRGMIVLVRLDSLTYGLAGSPPTAEFRRGEPARREDRGDAGVPRVRRGGASSGEVPATAEWLVGPLVDAIHSDWLSGSASNEAVVPRNAMRHRPFWTARWPDPRERDLPNYLEIRSLA